MMQDPGVRSDRPQPFRGLRTVGVALTVMLLFWIAWSLFASSSNRSVIFADLNYAFGGNAQLPKEEINASLTHAKARMGDLNSGGRTLKVTGEVAVSLN